MPCMRLQLIQLCSEMSPRLSASVESRVSTLIGENGGRTHKWHPSDFPTVLYQVFSFYQDLVEQSEVSTDSGIHGSFSFSATRNVDGLTWVFFLFLQPHKITLISIVTTRSQSTSRSGSFGVDSVDQNRSWLISVVGLFTGVQSVQRQ